jgi:septal ring factor EnvC (AmiA/AmiB activator)
VKALLVAIAALVLLAGVQTYRLMSLETTHAQYVAQIAGEKQIAESVARQTEQRHQTAIDQVQANALTQKAQDDAHAAELVAAGDSLRKQTGQLLADRAALRTRVAERGKTIDDLADLLAQLRAEADDHAGQLATALDASRRAGFACERSYDALRDAQ